MIAHTVTAYEEELKSLRQKISQMGGLAEHQVMTAMSAIAGADKARAKQAVAGDAAIDAMQREIEDTAVLIIARRQPVAVDLREVVGAMRIAGDLERIGDSAKSIGKRIAAFDDKALLSPMTKGLVGIGELALSQLKAVLDSYTQQDASLALDVWKRDEQIDRLYNSLFREFLTYMMEDPKTITFGAHLLFCAKNIERMGDHCTNIAEAVTYIATAQTIPDERPRHDAFHDQAV